MFELTTFAILALLIALGGYAHMVTSQELRSLELRLEGLSHRTVTMQAQITAIMGELEALRRGDQQ